MESPIVFEQSVWAAHAQAFVDYDEAIKAIEDYKLEYATMQRQDLKVRSRNE
jgi:hypothetical protein